MVPDTDSRVVFAWHGDDSALGHLLAGGSESAVPGRVRNFDGYHSPGRPLHDPPLAHADINHWALAIDRLLRGALPAPPAAQRGTDPKRPRQRDRWGNRDRFARLGKRVERAGS